MTVEVSIFLFGKPSWEIEGFEGRQLDQALIEQIRQTGRELNQSLDEAAEKLVRLLKNGWVGKAALYDVSLLKEVSLGEARRELAELGVDPDLAFEFEGSGDAEAPMPIEQ